MWNPVQNEPDNLASPQKPPFPSRSPQKPPVPPILPVFPTYPVPDAPAIILPSIIVRQDGTHYPFG